MNEQQQQFTRMEDMLKQLVGMVAKNNEKVDSISQEMKDMRCEMKTMRSEIASIKEDQQNIRADNERHHETFMRKFNNSEADQDYTFAKVIRNEREIAKLKGQRHG